MELLLQVGIMICTNCRTARSVELFRIGNILLRTCLICRERQNGEAAKRVAYRAMIPAARQWNLEDPSPLPDIYRCSAMHYECKNCKALHYLEEKLAVSSNRNPVFNVFDVVTDRDLLTDYLRAAVF